MRATRVVKDASELESFDVITEEEIVSLWRTFKASGLSGEQAWHAIVIGMALDMAFARTEALKRVAQ